MKKFIGIILSIIIVLSMSTTAYAAESSHSDDVIYVNTEKKQVGSFTIDEIKKSPLISDEATYSLYATRFFSFNNTPYNNIMSDFVEFEVQQGEEVRLTVTNSTWYPHTCDIEIGIYNVDDGLDYCETVSGGDYSGTMVFGDMDEATYIVYVRNVSRATISQGSIRYSIS